MKMLSKLILVSCIFGLTIGSQALASKSVPSWGLQTQDTVIKFSLQNGSPVVSTLSLVGAKGYNWAMATPEMSLLNEVEINGKSQKINWKYKGVTASQRKVSFTYVSNDPKLELVSTWESTDLPGPVEHSATLSNKTDKTIKFAPTPTIDLTMAGNSKSALEHWWIEKTSGHLSPVGTHTDKLVEGYSKLLKSTPYSQDDETRDAFSWFCIQDATNKHGIYGGIEFSGWTQIVISMPQKGKISASLGLHQDEGKARTRVNSGSSFKYPECFVGVYKGGVDDGSNRLHRWTEKHLRPPMPDGITPLLVNNSWGSGMAVNEELAKRMIDDSAALGIELYGVDAGWFVDVGNWYSHPTKLPNGLEKIADYAHSKGLKFGLWVGWTQGGALKDYAPNMLSPFNPAQRNWFGNDYGLDWKNSIFAGATVCLGCADARSWCLNQLRRMVKDYKLDLLEHDQGMVLDGCGREGHGHIPGDKVDTARSAANGYFEVYDQLRKENPNLIFENCVNGGRFIDFGIVKRNHYVCLSDDYHPLGIRRGFYDATYVLPPSMCEAYIANHAGTTPEELKYMLRSTMLGWCTIMVDTSVWNAEQHDIAKSEFVLYKTRLRPLIANANLFHVLPRPDDKLWDGMQYFDPQTGKGVLYVFHPPLNDQSEMTIKLCGLNPNKSYAIEAIDNSASGKISGKKLMEAGLTVKLPIKKSSDLVFINEVR